MKTDYHAMIVTAPGPPDALQWTSDHLAAAGPADLVIRHEAIGLNFHDTYVRSGAYRTMGYPGVPGIEAAGVVEWVGADVRDFGVGDRIAYVTAAYGAYATRRVLPATSALPLPDDITLEVAAAMLLKGITADMLLTRLVTLSPKSTVVVHAAAGGVGQILVQMAKARGLTVIGFVGNEEKAAIARALGCDHVGLYGADIADIVTDSTGGGGADMVLDGVGAATHEASLDSLKPFGHLALFGQASGPVPPIDPARLAKRSLSLSRPIVFHHIADAARYRSSGDRLFALIRGGEIVLAAPTRFALRDAPAAHALLESGASTGSLVLNPA